MDAAIDRLDNGTLSRIIQLVSAGRRERRCGNSAGPLSSSRATHALRAWTSSEAFGACRIASRPFCISPGIPRAAGSLPAHRTVVLTHDGLRQVRVEWT